MLSSIYIKKSYVKKIKFNNNEFFKLLEIPQNMQTMKNSLNIPVAVVDLFEKYEQGSINFYDKESEVLTSFSHGEVDAQILKKYNPNLKIIPFKVELDSGSLSLSSITQKLRDVCDVGDLKGVNFSIQSRYFGVQDKRILDSSDSEQVLNAREVIGILEKLTKGNVKVCIAAGNFEEPATNLYAFAENVHVVGAVDRKGKDIFCSSATDKALGDFFFSLDSDGKLKIRTLPSELATKKSGCSFASPKFLASLFPGAKTAENIEKIKKIVNRLKGNSNDSESVLCAVA